MYRLVSIPILAIVVALGAMFASAKTCLAWDECLCAHHCCCWECGCPPCAPNCFPGFCDYGYMKPISRAKCYSWNRNYSYTDFGQPTALVVPPTAQLQTNWGWGVASSRISRIDHQFQRNYPGNVGPGGPARPTPVWPSDTTQFGIFPVRAPW